MPCNFDHFANWQELPLGKGRRKTWVKSYWHACQRDCPGSFKHSFTFPYIGKKVPGFLKGIKWTCCMKPDKELGQVGCSHYCIHSRTPKMSLGETGKPVLQLGLLVNIRIGSIIKGIEFSMWKIINKLFFVRTTWANLDAHFFCSSGWADLRS